jgi:hypothetical protein
VHQDPHAFGIDRTRWTLRSLLSVTDTIAVRQPGGLWQVMRRLDIHYKQAREHLHSPDGAYVPKLQAIYAALREAVAEPERVVFLFEDEFTFYRSPALARAYEQGGDACPLAELGWRSNLRSRIAGALNVVSGQTHFLQRSTLGLSALVTYYAQLCQAYPDAEVIYLAQDNWPIHFHPDVLVALQPQTLPFPPTLPPNFPTEPRAKVRRLNLPIQILCLPTYAPWTNPIEKVWRMLRQEFLRLHPYRDAWEALKHGVDRFLGDLNERCEEVLRYVGLTDPLRLYHKTFQLHARAPT